MKWTDAVTKTLTVILPWAPRHERHAAIDTARLEKERSQAAAAQSRKVRQQITRLVHENGYAQHFRDTLRGDR